MNASSTTLRLLVQPARLRAATVWQAAGAARCDHLRELTVEKVLATSPASGLKLPVSRRANE
jgi:hypothetical protein